MVDVDSDGMTDSIATPRADPVAATDPNGTDDILTYTLGGRDKFDIFSGNDTRLPRTLEPRQKARSG